MKIQKSSGNFKRLIEMEGGILETKQIYGRDCDFRVPENPEKTLKTLQIYRALLLLFFIPLLVKLYLNTTNNPVDGYDYNFFIVMISYYSLQAILYAMISIMMSMLVPSFPGLNKACFIFQEMSFGVTFFLFAIQVPIMIPVCIYDVMNKLNERKSDLTFGDKMEILVSNLIIEGILVHMYPFVALLINYKSTKVFIRREDYWLAFITVFPIYTLFNIFGSFV